MRILSARKISFFFFIMLSGYGVVTSLYSAVIQTGTIFHLKSAIIPSILFLIFYLQYRYRLKHMDLLLGCISLLGSLYLVLAIGDDYLDWLRGEDHYNNPGSYFGFGFTIIALMNIMSCLMISGDSRKRSRADITG